MNPFQPTPPLDADKRMTFVAAFILATTIVGIVVVAALLIGCL